MNQSSSDRVRETSTPDMAIVRRFLEAWENFDATTVQQLFAENAVFCASIGPEPGRTFKGSKEIGPAIEKMLSDAKGTAFSATDLIAFDGGVVVTWTVNSGNGQVKGIDIFRVAAGKITLKDAYRKVAG